MKEATSIILNTPVIETGIEDEQRKALDVTLRLIATVDELKDKLGE